MTKLVILFVGVLLVGGCWAPGPDGSARSTGTTTSSAPTPVPDPTAISIPAIGANSTLVPLGLDENGELAVPPVTAPMQAGWWAGPKPDVEGEPGEVKPGERGSAVVVAHVDGVVDGQKGRPGLFHKLHELTPGDEVFIEQADGGQLRFLVERVERHDKDTFPTEAVYLADDMPRLNLVTCTGSFDRAAGHYEDNLIVFATLAPEQR